MSSDLQQSVQQGLTRYRIRKLIEATAGGLAQGEKLRVVTYTQYGDTPAILWWGIGVLAIWFVAIFLPFTAAFQNLLLVGFFCAGPLFIAYVLISVKWLCVVLTDRRLILFHQKAITKRPGGILLDVPRDHVSLQEYRPYFFNLGVKLVLRFDDTIGHAPIKLIFGANRLDAEAIHAALTDSAPGGVTATG